jgi:histone acetyltransferase (RNA polymerase elongator complex component)
MQSLLLKTPDQVAQARQSLAAYTQVQARLDQISQINHELLRRGQLLVGEVS